MRKGYFRVEGIDDTFEGFAKGESWCGFAVPYFTQDMAQEIVKLDANAEVRIYEAVRLIKSGLVTDGAHHKQWYLDQALQHLLGGAEYERWRTEIESEIADEQFPYDTGIAG